jgi:hypothetical protein
MTKLNEPLKTALRLIFNQRSNSIHDRRLPQNIRRRVIKQLKSQCCVDGLDNFYEEIDLDLISRKKPFVEILTRSLKSYQLLDRAGNICNTVEAIEQILNQSKNSKTLIYLLDEVTDLLVSQYQVIVDRRKMVRSNF